MGKNNCYFLFLIVFGSHFTNAQTVEIKGQLIGDNDLEGIHIINRTSEMFTVSNEKGKFAIAAKLNDTIQITGVSYEPQEVVVGPDLMNLKVLTIYLKEKINDLDEVVVGKLLTGDLRGDITNLGIERSINFHDLGLPGFRGIPKTQSERKLYDADHGEYYVYTGLSLSINVNKILNKLTGRTDALKYRVALENRDKCLNRIKSNLSTLLFSTYDLEEDHHNEFFAYCSGDPQFDAICVKNDDFNTLDFLKDKLISFSLNLKTTDKE